MLPYADINFVKILAGPKLVGSFSAYVNIKL